MEMAWIATNPQGDTYAICSADPNFIDDAAKEIKQWRKDGATIELLPQDEAKQMFVKCLPKQQLSLFGNP